MIRRLELVEPAERRRELVDARLLVVTSRLLELSPDSATDVRDRGLIAMRLGSPRVAEEDLARYLALEPEASDVAEIRRIVGRLREQTTAFN